MAKTKKIKRQDAINELIAEVKKAGGVITTRCLWYEESYKLALIEEYMLTPVSLFEEGMVETSDIVYAFMVDYLVCDIADGIFKLPYMDGERYVKRFVEETGTDTKKVSYEDVLTKFWDEIYNELKKHQAKVVRDYFRINQNCRWENISNKDLQIIYEHITCKTRRIID